MVSFPILSLLLWFPIVCGFLVIIGSRSNSLLAAKIGLICSILVFLISVNILFIFENNTSDFQFIERLSWIDYFNIQYYLGIDGISFPLILLSTFTIVISIFSAFRSVKQNLGLYAGLFLLLEGCILGVFMALDGILFYIFWEALMLPMFLIIGMWGGNRKIYAAMKFFLYTFLSSVLMLIAMIYLSLQVDSFAIDVFHQVPLSAVEQNWIFWAFFLPFAVKIPMVPVHTWLPDAHVEAPTAGSVILAAVLLKMGGYGFVRFNLPIVPDAVQTFNWLVIALSLIAIVYIGLVALAQSDMKKLVAYSSISHMGFVTLGIFLVLPLLEAGSLATNLAVEGAMVQMVSHGFISAALFLMIGVLYDRMHTRDISAYGGVIQKMPVFGFFVVLFAMANVGLPGTSGFIGEFMVILATFQANIWLAVVATLTLILGAAYTLWMIKRVFYGEANNERVEGLKDLDTSEKIVMTVLAIFVIGLGFYPSPLVNMMHESISYLIEQASHSKL